MRRYSVAQATFITGTNSPIAAIASICQRCPPMPEKKPKLACLGSALIALLGACAPDPSGDGAAPSSLQLLKTASTPAITLETSLQGRLTERDGCLIAITGDTAHAIIWPTDTTVSQHGAETTVESAGTGSHATVGRDIVLRGGAASGLDATHVDGGVVGDRGQCSGPYWLTFSFSSP